jgi:hypothetical protein
MPFAYVILMGLFQFKHTAMNRPGSRGKADIAQSTPLSVTLMRHPVA